MLGFKNTGGVEYLIVGLGNPDKKYENTRHNCGWMAIDHLADKLGCKVNKIKFKSFVGECRINNKRALLMKPTTYMNNSGQAVVEAMNFYKLPPENVIVIFDDISLDVGKMRIRQKGSDGGQKGMRSIIYLSGKDTFPRIKIGIGAKPNPDWDLADWVLSRFSKDEGKLLEEMFDNAADAIALMVDGKIDRAMNLYN
ncbi:MAG: aminoacyl-tRNA hydrolase [Ruminococcus sp.]|nr:aminoacyl-tRNA hydrolase [uncultured Ruminococcus sp.]MBQ1350403.1 aminoacyl-tRNA hydrolase [Ruminococcus sp.]SCX04392.1 peptidyl-tRNA hydrolase, PTH1 family [Ruminococcaceae bacterium P7]